MFLILVYNELFLRYWLFLKEQLIFRKTNIERGFCSRFSFPREDVALLSEGSFEFSRLFCLCASGI